MALDSMQEYVGRRSRSRMVNTRLQLMNDYFKHIFKYFDNWLNKFEEAAPIFERRAADTLARQDIPMWVNGMFRALTKTHFDDYFNFVYVLQGPKTFYVAKPDAITIKGTMRSKINGVRVVLKHNEAPWVIPKGSKPDLNCSYWNGNISQPQIELYMYKYVITQGTMLMIPPGYWHRVVSDPRTIMINFWYKPVYE